jgi:hypothetical protein
VTGQPRPPQFEAPPPEKPTATTQRRPTLLTVRRTTFSVLSTQYFVTCTQNCSTSECPTIISAKPARTQQFLTSFTRHTLTIPP